MRLNIRDIDLKLDELVGKAKSIIYLIKSFNDKGFRSYYSIEREERYSLPKRLKDLADYEKDYKDAEIHKLSHDEIASLVSYN